MSGPDKHTGHEHLEATRQYYDEFSRRYDAQRGGRVKDGYHDLIDDLEIGFVERFASGKRVLEVGCGTGLLLERIAGFASEAKGVDLSPGMLEHAAKRGLDVVEGSATALPFESDRFDVVCSFKVLAHVRDIATALAEMMRVTRPGGVMVLEFYNPWSLRGLVKKLGPAGHISEQTKESAVYTRFDTPSEVRAMLPHGCSIEAHRGVRIVTPAAPLLNVPVLGFVLRGLEHALADGPLGRLGGCWIAAIRTPPGS